ncbi:hypothetical protein QS430_07195 [Staphylococcus pseudintermedius]|nr:hypothetical protein QS430_07195 [Staphylococcus pseudintermedius]
MMENFASQLQSILHEDEWMLSLTQSDSNGSIYVFEKRTEKHDVSRSSFYS